jgi:FKBP-type peptidyl-prolyl cis-trans isomerase FklB
MKKTGILLMAVVLLMASCKPSFKNAKVESDIDSVSYLIGVMVANNIKNSGDFETINAEAFAKGVEEVFAKDSFKMNEMELQMKFQTLAEKFRKASAEKNKKASEEFLEKNKKQSGVITLPSGVQYKVIKEGNGLLPDSSDVVSVNYKGTLISGKQFDSNDGRGPAKLPIRGVFPGMTEALLKMKVGSKWTIYIPSDLAYGERGNGKEIKGNMALIFDVEVLGIEPKAASAPDQASAAPVKKGKK